MASCSENKENMYFLKWRNTFLKTLRRLIRQKTAFAEQCYGDWEENIVKCMNQIAFNGEAELSMAEPAGMVGGWWRERRGMQKGLPKSHEDWIVAVHKPLAKWKLQLLSPTAALQ